MFRMFCRSCALLVLRLCGSNGYGITLEQAARVPVRGNAGFEAFQMNGTTYIAAASFWDGRSHDLSSKSALFKVTGIEGSQSLSVQRTQQFPTKGAHGWDFFEASASSSCGEGGSFLVLPNYYGCGNNNAATKSGCKSTDVYRWKSAGDKSKFVIFQRLATAGPGQTDHFVLDDGRVFIVVGENFNNEVCIFQLMSNSQAKPKDQNPTASCTFAKVQCLVCKGAGAVAVIKSEDGLRLAVASYNDPETGWKTSSAIFRLRAVQEGPAKASPGASSDALYGFEGFQQQQLLSTWGAHDVEHAFIVGKHFLFFSEDRNDTSTLIDSQMFVCEGGARSEPACKLLQHIPTDGAHAAEMFEMEGTAWLAVANFGDRLGQRYASQSTVWRFDKDAQLFSKVAEVATHGATDWEHFAMGGQHFLAVSNEGDMEEEKFQESYIYRLSSSPISLPDAAHHRRQSPSTEGEL